LPARIAAALVGTALVLGVGHAPGEAAESSDENAGLDQYLACYRSVIGQIDLIEGLRAQLDESTRAAALSAKERSELSKVAIACDQRVNRFNSAANFLRAREGQSANGYMAILTGGTHLGAQPACATVLPEVGADSYDAALAAYDSGDHQGAFAEFNRLAELGHFKAQYKLGVMYSKGEATQQDLTTAARWWMKAGKRGYVDAQYNLGATFNAGAGVPKNPDRAVQWFEMAAVQGDVGAMQMAAVDYFTRQGDFVKAHMWLSLGESLLGPGDAREAFGQNRAALEEKMTPEQIGSAKAMVGEVEAQIMMGLGATSESGTACSAS
jgi:TPR repeat protein